MQCAFDKKIAEQPLPKVVADLQAAKSRVMSAASENEGK
jgi:hypothetical protein